MTNKYLEKVAEDLEKFAASMMSLRNVPTIRDALKSSVQSKRLMHQVHAPLASKLGVGVRELGSADTSAKHLGKGHVSISNAKTGKNTVISKQDLETFKTNKSHLENLRKEPAAAAGVVNSHGHGQATSKPKSSGAENNPVKSFFDPPTKKKMIGGMVGAGVAGIAVGRASKSDGQYKYASIINKFVGNLTGKRLASAQSVVDSAEAKFKTSFGGDARSTLGAKQHARVVKAHKARDIAKTKTTVARIGAGAAVGVGGAMAFGGQTKQANAYLEKAASIFGLRSVAGIREKLKAGVAMKRVAAKLPAAATQNLKVETALNRANLTGELHQMSKFKS